LLFSPPHPNRIQTFTLLEYLILNHGSTKVGCRVQSCYKANH
jgi:hypothetical protein